jgi:hypothetical protein
MSIEDRVRTATRVGATLVRDIRPLAEPDRAGRRGQAPVTRRWVSWGVPLAAAAAVALVALTLVTVRHLSARAPQPSGPAATPTSVPRYYVALDQEQTVAIGPAGSSGKAGPELLVVGDDSTGNAIATVSQPRGMQFVSVQGAPDDRTFVVMAAVKTGLPPYTWYLLRIAPGTAHPYQLTKLRVKLPVGSPNARAFALSPDGRDLAIESLDNPSRSAATGTTLGVYSVSSGAELRAWTTSEDITQGLAEDTLSWLSNGRELVFSNLLLGAHRGADMQNQLRTIDLAGSGTDLLTDSRELLTVSTPVSSPASCWTMYVAPDGGTVICGVQYAVLSGGGTAAGCANGGLEFTAYSVRADKPFRVLYRYQGPCRSGLADVLWADASGRYVIGALEFLPAGQGGQQTGRLGVISDGRLLLLPVPKALPASAYRTVVF